MYFSIPALIFFHVEEILGQDEIAFVLPLTQPAVSSSWKVAFSLVVRSYS